MCTVTVDCELARALQRALDAETTLSAWKETATELQDAIDVAAKALANHASPPF